MFQVYILYSYSIDRFYIGQTENIETRKGWHDGKIFPKNFTVRASDWVIFLTIECKSRQHAIQIETHIKKMKSKKYIQNLNRYPEIVENLKNKYDR